MGRGRYSRRGSGLGSVVSDSAAIANGFGPKGALVVGVIGFVIFYFMLPAALETWADYNKAKMTSPLAPIFGKVLDDVIFRRFIHPCEWTGIAILLACLAVAGWKAATQSHLTRGEERGVTLFSKLLARLLD